MVLSIMMVITAVVALLIIARQDALSMDLRQFQWKNRLLFLFAPQRSDSLFTDLQDEITVNKTEAEDRDMVIFVIFESEPSFINSENLDVQSAAALRKKFDIPPGRFTAILVGKDGGVKLKQHTGVKLNDIFALIDAMPMRQEEMRQKSE